VVSKKLEHRTIRRIVLGEKTPQRFVRITDEELSCKDLSGRRTSGQKCSGKCEKRQKNSSGKKFSGGEVSGNRRWFYQYQIFPLVVSLNVNFRA
jgi:hypothetical protein